MSVFKAFEAEVLTQLAAPVLGRPLVDSLLIDATLASYTYSGTGYFLTVRHPSLPAERLVCATPALTGRLDELLCGFVIFIEQGELMLECHSWTSAGLPPDVRERAVRVEVG